MAVIGGAGGGIKSIQRGTTACSTQTSTQTATINAVDLAKSFISSSYANGSDVDYYVSAAYFGWSTSLSVGATLTNTTTLTFTVGSNSTQSGVYTTNPTIYWEVVEYE